MDLPLPAVLASIGQIPLVYWVAPVGAITALIMARVFTSSVMKESEGDEDMVHIAQAVRDGAMAYLKRQYKVVASVFVLLVIVLGALAALELQPVLSMLGVPIAGFLSGLCGWFGMKMATNASARTTFAAKQSLNEGLTVAFRSGAVMGLNVVGFALLDISVWFLLLNGFGDSLGMDGNIAEYATIMLSFGMGASTQALFARVGGGIYTKAADVGADLVGKVEAGIPEDDPRNPATIADNVGDNVGDVAGMGADLYESYYGSILATIALGTAAAFSFASGDEQNALAFRLAAAPLAIAGAGIFCSIVGVFTVKAKEGASFAQLLKGLHGGVYLASGLIILATLGILYGLLGSYGSDSALATAGGTSWWRLGGAVIVGLVAGNVIALATEYYTSYEKPPTQRISEQARTGPATVIIAGIAEGMKSTWASLLTVVIAILMAFSFAGGNDSFLMGLYGVGIAAVGMLSTLGITLATDAYGPIADNAGGNAEMTSQPAFVRERTDMLDSLGNTTAAMGKGFAIGSAALTALALFAAYIQVVQIQITKQTETYVAASASTTSTHYAEYMGYGKFAVVVPGADGADPYVDGAMFISERANVVGDSEFDFDSLQVGNVFQLTHAAGEDHHGHSYADEADHLREATRFTIHREATGEAGAAHFDITSSRNGSIEDVLAFYDVSLTNPRVLSGLFMGVLLAFLFCAMTMNAVGRAAYAMMAECRRQFGKIREALRQGGMSEEDVSNPDNWPREGVDLDGHHYPDYANCVAISTAGAQKAMVVPALLALFVPIAVGLILGVPGVMGLLAGGLTSGFAVAVFMANAGGAWDNAKKFIESFGKITASDVVNKADVRQKLPERIRDSLLAQAEEFVRAGKGDEIVYGKGSEDHKATVVGDTVGDPFKDTSGPSLNILIKLISIVSVVFAGLVVKFGPAISSFLGIN